MSPSEELPLEERARARGWARRALYGGGGLSGAVARGAGRPLAKAWEALAARRLTTPREAVRLPAPAIAIGNVTIGGGGKTSLVEWLLDEGLPPASVAAVLTRGYGREAAEVWVLEPGAVTPELVRAAGDEPALLARHGAWVGVGADRALAARAVVDRVRPDLFLLDDALQHRRVARALDLVTFAAGDLSAPARCVPAGPLRQGPGWRPAMGAWIVAGGDPLEREWPTGSIGAAFAAWWRELPGTPAEWRDAGAVTLASWWSDAEVPFDLRSGPVVAFAGVARPESVRRTAQRADFEVAALAAFPDHWSYRQRDVAALLRDHPAVPFVTTEKDAVKLDPAWFGDRPVGVLRRRLAPLNPSLLRDLVAEALGRTPWA